LGERRNRKRALLMGEKVIVAMHVCFRSARFDKHSSLKRPSSRHPASSSAHAREALQCVA